MVLGYRSHLVDRKLSPATINRRLAALRSLVKLGRTLGVITCTLEVPNLKAQAYRDDLPPSMCPHPELGCGC
jgi:integrase/recombinase XerC